LVHRNVPCAVGWVAVGMSTLVACFWALWGIIENFHEGWYEPSLAMNLGIMVTQYLLPTLLFLAAALAGIFWPRSGGSLHWLAGFLVIYFFRGSNWSVVYLVLAGPLFLLGIGYWFGRLKARRYAAAMVVGLPLLTMVAFGVVPAARVASRFDDGDRRARLVVADQVGLVWAASGPGWPRDGVSWDEARQRCCNLSRDGTRLEDAPQNIWRLPTVEEAVASQFRHGENCGGKWDARRQQARYERAPDKESPLWDPKSKVIYWWTATEVDEDRAYIIVYDGKVWPRKKHSHWGYLGFRAVKSPD
jgi:hypothetical protein